MSMPTISYCCIFKNEEKHLPKWIECAKAVACGENDEIIACDTGSDDKSCEILKNAGIEPIYFEWVNDFSKAKNFVIDKAKGDWIFFMDCDEYFSDESLPIVREVVKKLDPTNAMFIQSNMINIDEDNDNTIISTCFHWRIFRNRPDIRYEKAIHEFVNYHGKGKGTITPVNDLTIMHTGYSIKMAKAKGERNLKLLEEEIAKNETDELTTPQAFYMANTYGQMDDLNKAAEYAQIAIKGPDRELEPMIVKMYRFVLAREEKKPSGPDYDWVMELLDEALLRAPDQPDFLLDKIRYYYPRKYYYEIENLCHKYIKSLGNPTIMNRCESQALGNVFYIYEVLADMMFHRGQVIEARRYITLALKERPKSVPFLQKFVSYFRYEELSIIQPIMNEICKTPDKEDKERFKSCFAQMNYGDVYLRYVKPKNNTFEYFMCKGLYSKAVKLCEKELIELFKYAAFAYAKFPNEARVFKAAVPTNYLTGAKKCPTGDEMSIKDLADKFLDVLSRIIMACYSMTDDEFEKNKNGIMKYLTSPAKDFLLAGFGQATQGVQLEDTKSFYKRVITKGNRNCIARLAKTIQVMPVNDEFLYEAIMTYAEYKDPQSMYNLTQKLENKNYDYHILTGVAFLYANDPKNARKHFVKARELGADTQELRDFIKMTDPAEKIVINLGKQDLVA